MAVEGVGEGGMDGREQEELTSMTGTRKARVLPLPVTASTTTSLLPRKMSKQAFWTGVGRSKPEEDR